MRIETLREWQSIIVDIITRMSNGKDRDKMVLLSLSIQNEVTKQLNAQKRN